VPISSGEQLLIDRDHEPNGSDALQPSGRHRRVNSVLDYLTPAVPTATATDMVADVVASLTGGRFDSIHSVYVVNDERKLVGAAPLAAVFAAARDAPIGDLMQRNPPSVRADLDREGAASVAIREELVAVPVVDDAGRFLGVFPPRAIMGVLREEHLEDLHHMAGIWHQTDAARQALEAPPIRRARYRLPWLVVGLAGSLIATTLVAQFERVLEAQIAVAFFIPAIVYLADAVGTQSEAVAIRGLSLTDAGIRRILLGEISAGLLIGLILALLAGAFTVVAFDAPRLALAVGTSLLAACTIASSLGLCLPWVFSRVGWDPAHASGPIGTIVQDVLSLAIYFGAASVML
jgi:magnesium transporter